MTCEKFETVIGYHCSPVLMGLKPSNLVSFSKEQAPKLPELLASYNEELSEKGIRMQIICGCRKHYLVLVYRPKQLMEYLKKEEMQELLSRDGYEKGAPLEKLLVHLTERFEKRKEFPHEIGVFLGYPLEDVEGFCKYQGNDCKLCGYWKVYGDVEQARSLFAQFDRCREFLQEQMQNGYSISQVLGMKQSGG